jgi:hypothetical protein
MLPPKPDAEPSCYQHDHDCDYDPHTAVSLRNTITSFSHRLGQPGKFAAVLRCSALIRGRLDVVDDMSMIICIRRCRHGFALVETALRG